MAEDHLPEDQLPEDQLPEDRSIALYGHPSMLELVEATREFLADEVFPATEGRVQFHTRVSIRVLDTVARQIRLGAAHLADHADRLASLGYASDRELVEAIRAGHFDQRIGELAAVLEEDVRSKLEVADPRYLST